MVGTDIYHHYLVVREFGHSSTRSGLIRQLVNFEVFLASLIHLVCNIWIYSEVVSFSSTCLSIALQPLWTLTAFFCFLIYTQSVGLLGWGMCLSQGRYLHTDQHTHRINVHTGIHALIGIQTHDPSVRAGEDGSCLSPRGHCDRLHSILSNLIGFMFRSLV
jgi:hypothetical protein